MSYFDLPPCQRVLREFTLRPDAAGHWVASEIHGLVQGVFFTYEQARRFALRETDRDPTRILVEATLDRPVH